MKQGKEISLSARGLVFGGLRWNYAKANTGVGCRVLCVHGWLDNAASFNEIAPRFADAGCDVVSLDLPGHGRSAHRGAGSLQFFVEYIADVVSVLDALGWESAVLLGHSLGAGVMACTAGVVPDRVRALLLLEGVAPQPMVAEQTGELLRKAIDAQARGAGDSSGYESMDEAIVARRKGYWPLSDDAARQILERALTLRDDGRLRWHTDARLRQPSGLRLTDTQLTSLLTAVNAPSFLVRAENGLFTINAAFAERAAQIAGIEQVTLSGSHHLHLEPETAAAVADVLLAFMKKRGVLS